MRHWQPLILILTLVGCATSTEDVEDESAVAADRVCVNVRNITSFDAIDDRHLYVRARGQPEHYLFTMDGTCIGLRGAHTIAVKDTFSRVCSNTFGEVIYRDLGRGLDSCRIRNVEAVASREDAAGLVKDRREAKREEQEKKKQSKE